MSKSKSKPKASVKVPEKKIAYIPEKRSKKRDIIVLLIALLQFVGVFICANAPFEKENIGSQNFYVEYERAIVREVLEENVDIDTEIENIHRGTQALLVEIMSGQYKGGYAEVLNYMGALYDTYAKVGTRMTLSIRTSVDEEPSFAVYDYDRSTMIYVVIAAFVLVTVLVGGKIGVKSLFSLLLSLVCIIWILIPLLMKGFPTIITIWLICVFITVFTFVLIDGISRKTIPAILGTISGVLIATLFALAAGALSHIDGLKLAEIEPLYQARFQGTPVQLRGLFAGGVIIAALGAVMSATIRISSAMTELVIVNPSLSRKELMRRGMNIGRDTIGTMLNTLILAFVGSGFTMMMVLWSYDIPYQQLLASPYLSLELIHGVAGSVGVILAVPLTAWFSSMMLRREVKAGG